MELILWRHAEAEDGVPDMARQLTGKGMKQAEKMASFLRDRLPLGVHIIASPAKRTQQTVMALTKNFITEPAIAPGASSQTILEIVNRLKDKDCVLLVGHQPTLGEVAAILIAGKPEYWNIKKGAVWWLSTRERNGTFDTTLRLVISPDLL
jgi:phosphohistidine phosphatase